MIGRMVNETHFLQFEFPRAICPDFQLKNISIHEADFREALSRTATTVSVVSTDDLAGRAGLTVSAMCPVSTQPPVSVGLCKRRERSMQNHTG